MIKRDQYTETYNKKCCLTYVTVKLAMNKLMHKMQKKGDKFLKLKWACFRCMIKYTKLIRPMNIIDNL